MFLSPTLLLHCSGFQPRISTLAIVRIGPPAGASVMAITNIPLVCAGHHKKALFYVPSIAPVANCAFAVLPPVRGRGCDGGHSQRFQNQQRCFYEGRSTKPSCPLLRPVGMVLTTADGVFAGGSIENLYSGGSRLDCNTASRLSKR